MWDVWDESGDGEIDFDEFAEMFNMSMLVLAANRKELNEDGESDGEGTKKEDDEEDDDEDDGEESDDPVEDEAEMWAARRTSPPTCMDENDETISPREYAFFCRQTGILDNKKVKIRTIQEIFRLVNSEMEDDGDSGSGQFRARGDAEFERAEFLASLCHVALKRFPQPPPPPPKPKTPPLEKKVSDFDLDDDWFSDSEDEDEDGEESEDEEEEEKWKPGDSVRQLIEELVLPSMEDKFQEDDLTGRSRAYRGKGAGSCLRLSVW